MDHAARPRHNTVASLYDRLARRLDIIGLRVTRGSAGWMMDGEAPCYEAKREAERVARSRLDGPVFNRLRVVPEAGRPCDGDLRQAVVKALNRRQSLAKASLSVDVRDGVVTLRGQTRDQRSACWAEFAAWSVRGVRGVVNQITVGPPAFERAG